MESHTAIDAARVNRVDYADASGIKRRVLLPDGISDPREGIPVSLDVDSLYSHCSLEFRRALVDELWARDLVEPCDFKRPGAAELIRASLLAVAKQDALSIISFAHEECRK